MTAGAPLTWDRSVDLLVAAQTSTGAIPASTVHEVYRYGWIRDSSWCAYALDVAGHRAAAAAWHHWVAETVVRHEHRIDEALAAVRADAVTGAVMLPARFTLAGEEESPGSDEQEWPNFQTDCYGFWLWALADHVRRGGKLTDVVERGARLVVRYLMGAGETPCFDCWEEYPGHRHTASLAAVAAGLRDAGALLGDRAAEDYAEQIRQRLVGPDHTFAGGFIRFPGDPRVDGSLLWLGVPWGIVAVDDPLYVTTIGRIRDELLRPEGGVWRYQGDAFFGGSQWILLAASLGWAATATGDRDLAHRLREWIESTATGEGYLPEQTPLAVQSPRLLTYWQHEWGTPATPLLWSHAMHVVLLDALRASSKPDTHTSAE